MRNAPGAQPVGRSGLVAATIPELAIFVFALGSNFLGDGLDPRLRRT